MFTKPQRVKPRKVLREKIEQGRNVAHVELVDDMVLPSKRPVSPDEKANLSPGKNNISPVRRRVDSPHPYNLRMIIPRRVSRSPTRTSQSSFSTQQTNTLRQKLHFDDTE